MARQRAGLTVLRGLADARAPLSEYRYSGKAGSAADRPDPPGPDTLAIAKVLGEPTSQLPSVGLGFRLLPVAFILAVQASLSVHLLWARSAFEDEALYLWAGRLEWAHWLHGATLPTFETYFSGSPVLYPPLGALADTLGGLTGARLLSLGFMLGTTVLLHATALRLYGRRAALLAAGMFAALGPTLHLSAFATYDPMALFLAAVATWCVVRAPRKGDAARWMVWAALALALCNATKYAVALFDPVVVAVATLSAFPAIGWRCALRRGALLTGCTAAVMLTLLKVGGSLYLQGVSQTTTHRQYGDSTVTRVLMDSWQWTAPVIVLAVAAVIFGLVRRLPLSTVSLTAVLAGAAFLVPAEQARILTTVSLDKHVDFGMWFASIAAGSFLASVFGRVRRRIVRIALTAVTAACIVPVAVTGVTQSEKLVNWPDSSRLIAALRPLTAHGGHFLAEASAVPQYYLPDTSWRQWSNTYSITLPSGLVRYEGLNPQPYITAIKHHYFSVIVLDYVDTPAEDQPIVAYLNSDKSYRAVNVPAFPHQARYLVWHYVPTRGK